MTPEARLNFVSDISKVNWTEIEDPDPTIATKMFNKILAKLIDQNFPEKT